MPEDEFEEIAKEALKAIPREFLDKLDNVAIVTQDLPSFYQLTKLRLRGRGHLLLGLYEGTPQTKRGHYNIRLPDKITIFKKPILAIARSRADLKLIIRNTIWHEIAHHFGMNERKVRQAERKRRERLLAP